MIAFTPKNWTKTKLNRWQQLMTAEQARAIPELYAQDGKGLSATAYIKFFAGGRTWFATEFDRESGQFFGYCVNHADPDMSELGYFQADELCARQVPGFNRSSGQLVPVVERDLHFKPCAIAEAVKKLTGRDISAPPAKPEWKEDGFAFYKAD